MRYIAQDIPILEVGAAAAPGEAYNANTNSSSTSGAAPTYNLIVVAVSRWQALELSLFLENQTSFPSGDTPVVGSSSFKGVILQYVLRNSAQSSVLSTQPNPNYTPNELPLTPAPNQNIASQGINPATLNSLFG